MENDANQKLYEHSEKLKVTMNKNRIPYSEHRDKDAYTLEIKYPKSNVTAKRHDKCIGKK